MGENGSLLGESRGQRATPKFLSLSFLSPRPSVAFYLLQAISPSILGLGTNWFVIVVESRPHLSNFKFLEWTTMRQGAKLLWREQAKLAASSIENIVNGSSGNGKEPVVAGSVNMQVGPMEPKVITQLEACASDMGDEMEVKVMQGPNCCSTCKKRVGLTGFSCRCGNLFCAVHRYSDKHNCPFDYRTAARDAIAKANPVVKAEKLDKI
ncbi:hypothetical protein Nepgr_009436 [Nepenthes gracilis]|uniref:AN1-type domain-containing protein n=1 Tax=Nepenthes gracilis TaxID=150966 RepID=A0AAD3SBA9_NEPGR|nr:hypothetical protein Nepgr_009436 [Nepenthes gracilis]